MRAAIGISILFADVGRRWPGASLALEVVHRTALIPVLVAAFALATASLPLAIRAGKRLGLTATPAIPIAGRMRVPEFGGISIVGATILSLAMCRALSNWLLFGAGAMLLVGVIDDAFELRPYQKFACQLLICGWAAIFALPRFALTPWHVTDFALAILWLLATSNAFNLIDGLDGLAAGVGVIAAGAIAATALMHGAALVALTSIAVAGALAAFMFFNFPPASIIMGDAGALPIGFILGALALSAGEIATNSRLTKYVFPILVMLVPLLDTGVVCVTRLATGSWISRHGRDHSHHRLLALGLSDRAAITVCWSVGAVGAVCGFATNVLTHQNMIVALPFLVLAAAIVAMFMIDLSFETNSPGDAYQRMPAIARHILSLGYKRRVAEAAIDFALISGAFLGAFALRLDFQIGTGTIGGLLRELPYVAIATYPAFATAGIYRGIWRYTSLSDGLRFAGGSLLGGFFLFAGSFLMPISLSGSIVVLFVILLFNLLVATRVSFRALRRGISQLASANERVLVVGAGEKAAAAANFVFHNRRAKARVIGFIDDDAFKLGKILHGQRVLGGFGELERIYGKSPFEELLVASDDLPAARMGQLAAFAERHGVAMRRFSIQVS